MLSANDVLVASLVASKELIVGFCQDLTGDEFLHRPTPAANCVAWLLGHLTLTDRRIMNIALNADDLSPLPDPAFEQRFGRAAGSPQAQGFGDTSLLLPLFADTRDRFIAKVQVADPQILDQPLAVAHPRFKTVFAAVNFMGIHTALHAGQISMIRRSLGRPPLV